MKVAKFAAQVAGKEREVAVEALEDKKYRVVVDGEERIVDARRIDATTWSILIDGEARLVDVEPGKEGEIATEVRGVGVPVKLVDPRKALLDKLGATRARENVGPMPVRAPMPGRVVTILVKPGDAVTTGQGLVVVEAMKMENELRAVRDGTVDKVHAKEGQPVEAQEVLITLA
jgi:biotin carboxyl carrier protein